MYYFLTKKLCENDIYYIIKIKNILFYIYQSKYFLPNFKWKFVNRYIVNKINLAGDFKVSKDTFKLEKHLNLQNKDIIDIKFH